MSEPQSAKENKLIEDHPALIKAGPKNTLDMMKTFVNSSFAIEHPDKKIPQENMEIMIRIEKVLAGLRNAKDEANSIYSLRATVNNIKTMKDTIEDTMSTRPYAEQITEKLRPLEVDTKSLIDRQEKFIPMLESVLTKKQNLFKEMDKPLREIQDKVDVFQYEMKEQKI